MTEYREKVPGIIGGMGPEATIDLMRRILRLTPANDDQEHIHCLVDNNTKIPSRIKAIVEGTGESPAACLADTARRLESWGADFLAMPCNTAHYYLQDIRSAVRAPVLDIISIALAAVRAALPAAGGNILIGLLGSPALRITGLYEQKARAVGATILYPTEEDQLKIFDLIKQVKAGRSSPDMRNTLTEVVDNLAGQGGAAAILACTELSVITGDEYRLPVFDALEELAKEIVRLART